MNTRDQYLDFTKGFLVFSMIVYHTFNYFSTAGYAALQYVRFSTGGFIFISGYLVATYYKDKYILNRKAVCKRLWIRGFKLILIFITINFFISLAGIESHKTRYDIYQLLNNLMSLFFFGDTSGLAFPILVPIAYALILSPLFLFFHGWRKSLSVFVFLLILAYVVSDLNNFLLFGLLIGIAAIVIGMFIDPDKQSYSINSRPVILFLFFICVFFMKYFDRNVLTYILGVLIIIKLTYDFSRLIDPGNPISKAFVLWGQYSLVCYLTQIFLLQALRHFAFKGRYELGFNILLIVIIVSVLLWISCRILDFFRQRFPVVDKSYRVIFS